MDVKMRIQISRLIEQMDKHPEYAEKLGLENTSVFCATNEVQDWGVRKKTHINFGVLMGKS